MSKGSPVRPLRIPQELLDQVLIQLERSEPYRRGEPWTLSSFIRVAILEKLEKMRRSRRPRKRKGKQQQPAQDLVTVHLGDGVHVKAPPEECAEILDGLDSLVVDGWDLESYGPLKGSPPLGTIGLGRSVENAEA